jgi:hypothetical protein
MFKMSSSYWSCLLEKKNVSASRVIPISLRGRALILAKTCVMTVTGGGEEEEMRWGVLLRGKDDSSKSI